MVIKDRLIKASKYVEFKFAAIMIGPCTNCRINLMITVLDCLESPEQTQNKRSPPYLSVMSLLGWVAHIGGVGQHVRSVNVIDGLGLWKGSQVFVVQHLLS